MSHEKNNPLTSCITEVKKQAATILGLTFEEEITLRGINYRNVIVPVCPITTYVKLSIEPICHWDILNDMKQEGLNLMSAEQKGENLHCEFSHFNKTIKTVGKSMSEVVFKVLLYLKTTPSIELCPDTKLQDSAFVAA